MHLTHNTLANNPKVAIMMRDSDVTIENNTLSHNGFGIVSILTQGSLTPQIRGNLIEAKVFKGNALDQPVHGVYKMPAAP